MGFVDSLMEHSDADIVLVDRRHRPGGHWHDSYPFVQLHQPSMNYGVNSMPLGQDDRIESRGTDSGFYERASGAEICGYYDDVPVEKALAFETALRQFMKTKYAKITDKIETTKEMSADDEKALAAALEDFKKTGTY